jgi:hypothetical protein
MNNELLIIRKRNFTALLFFVIIIFFSFRLLSPQITKSLIFHFIQYILVLVVFSKQFQFHIEKSKIRVILFALTMGIIFFFCNYILRYLVNYYENSQQYLPSEFVRFLLLFFLVTLIPILYIFVSEFIIGKKMFDEKKYCERRNVIIQLKERGSISESDFTLKMNNLNELKIKTEVVLSNDYRKLKREFKKGNISQKEMDDYVLNEISKMNNMNQ